MANLHATTANLTSVFNGAKGGDVIALAAGNYGSFQGGSKGATVTLQPEPGAAVTMSVSFGTADHIKIDGFTLVGAELDNAHDIALVNCKFTDQLLIYAKVTSANILIDHDTFDGISVCTNCYEGRVQIIGDATPSGVTVSNSHFGSGGDSDGLQIGADGVQVGPGNEFDHIIQVNYTRHIDPLQFYGETHTFVTGNYFHDNSTGIMSPDGGKGERIENNVFDMSASGYAACACSHIPGLVVRHNTVIGASFRIDDTNNYQPGQPATTATVTDNLIEGGLSPLYYGTLVDDYNMIDSGKGSHDLAWAPHFTGGTHPNTRAGFRLVPGTAGTLKASDGTNISAIIPSCLPRAEDSAAKKPPMNGRRCAHSAAGRSLLVRRRDASRPCGKSSTTPALRKATGATPCCSKRCKTSRMRFVRLREPFSTADAESIEIHLVGDDLEVRFQDWEEQPVHLQFSETIAFRWDPCGGEDAPRDDEPYEVLESPWAARLVASRQAERCRHFKLCFNAASVLDVVSREIVVFRP